MRLYLTIFFAVSGLLTLHAQTFQQKFEVPLSDTLRYHDLAWVDFDNDSLLDVLVKASDAGQRTVFLIFKSNLTTTPVFEKLLQTSIRNTAYQLTDFDGDNQIDILVTGLDNGVTVTAVLMNKSGFEFEQTNVLMKSGSLVKYADLDMDGKPELMLTGGVGENASLHIYKGKDATWNVKDTIHLQPTSIEVWDFNKDMFNDLFVSGFNAQGQPESRLYLSAGPMKYKDTLVVNLAGRTSVSDFNEDGVFDVVVAGKDANGISKTTLVSIGVGGCKKCFELKGLEALNNAQIFAGDLNSDGKCDMSLLGQTAASSDSLNLVWDGGVDYDTVDFATVYAQAFGDFDRDGDLDIAGLTNSKLAVAENKTVAVNKPPGKPQVTMAARVFDYILLEWLPVQDDRTNQRSITYDVMIETGAENLVSGSFDITHNKRLLVSHGNGSTNNGAVVRADGGGAFGFMVQSVDNAYHADKSSTCIGTGGNLCVDVKNHEVLACTGEEISLTAQRGEGTWFSFQKGMLGSGSSISYVALPGDTVVVLARTLSGAGCMMIDAFIIEKKTTMEEVVYPTRYVCTNMEQAFSNTGEWEQVLWSSTLQGSIASTNAITYFTAEDDTVFLTVSNGEGCGMKYGFPIMVSKPTVEVVESTYQILRDESVQLGAMGGESYEWSPGETLDDPSLANPMARPLSTTTYTVTATDTLGCTATAQVLVIVETTAFIPTLFTPNEDGKNDVLRAFGLDQAANFRFTIFNREGSLVFSTNSASDLTSRGWDGTVKGVKQPAGIYYWKVEGENNTGNSLMLNGKNMGSIVLIR